MSVKLIQTKEFNDILKNDIVIVDFFANWCGPCKMISPIIEELSNEMENVVFAKIDVDKSSEIAGMFNVMSIPTLILFKNGKLIDKKVGFISKEVLKNWIISNK